MLYRVVMLYRVDDGKILSIRAIFEVEDVMDDIF
jgi:ketosteroid isomerase-like protein